MKLKDVAVGDNVIILRTKEKMKVLKHGTYGTQLLDLKTKKVLPMLYSHKTEVDNSLSRDSDGTE